jgi:hypothetical protein
LHPLESAAFSRRTQTAVIPGTQFFEADDRRGHAISIPFFKKPFRDLKLGFQITL